MMGLQELIHKFEEGEGTRWIKLGAAVLGLLALAVVYDLREFKNFNTVEAMDAAQLARNLAEGRGYTTDFLRPLSLHLTQERRGDGDMGLKSPHPDLANPPVYPLVLAALMKVLPFSFDISDNALFLRHQPEVLIAFFNQALFLVAAWWLFRLAQRLFDVEVAAVATIIFLGSEIFWRFSVSGLSTMLLLVILIGLVDCLVRLEIGTREEGSPRGEAWFLGRAALVGLLAGVGTLTRYSFGWLIVPVLVYLALFTGGRRIRVCAIAFVTFALVVSPWLARNYSVCGKLFGTAGYALAEGTEPFPDNRLSRSLKPDTSLVEVEMYVRKLLVNAAETLKDDLPRLGGSWVSAFFLVGLMVFFRNPSLNRLRIFLLLTIVTLIPVQALGRTHLSADSPEINGENLLVLLAPLVFVFGAGFFFTLLEQMPLPVPRARLGVIVIFGMTACSSLLVALLPPRSFPLAYPPYYPPLIQQVSEWMGKQELMMSDVPWAVAWYGRRTCIWTVLDVERDFYVINDYQRPVAGLYLTQVTTDAKFHSHMVKPRERGWEWFIVQGLVKTNLPPGFPLKMSRPDIFELGQVFLTDRDRWSRRTE